MANTCPACGRTNDDDARYCPGCAEELPVRCGSCGASLAPDAVFCRACGNQVGRGGSGHARPTAAPPGIDDTQVEPRAGGASGGAGAPRADAPRPAPGPAPAPTVYAGPGPRAPFAPPPTPPPGRPAPARQSPPDRDRDAGWSPASSPGRSPVAAYGGAPQAPPPGASYAPPQNPPPVVPPPPAPPAGGGGGRRRGLPVWLLVLAVVAVVAAAAAVAVALLRPGDDGGDKHASASPSASASASASPSATSSPSASPTASPTAAAGFPMAVAGGRKGNVLTTVDAGGAAVPLSGKLGAQVFQIAWSPDGRRLACVAGDWEAARLWLADVEAGSVSEFAFQEPAVVAVDSVAWLSSTELLVAGYTATPSFQGDVAELLVCDAEAGSVVGPLEDGSGTSLQGISVSSSADGSRVAYVTYTDQKTNSYGTTTASERLELLDRNAGTVTELGIGKAFFDANARRFDEPLISPDGNAVIFKQAGSDVGTSYTVVDAKGTTVMHSKELNFPAGYAWDPTGEKVVYTGHSISSNGGKNDYVTFYVFDRAAGGKPRRLATYRNTMVQELSWSPDGATIAFAEWERKSYSTGTVYQLSASGGDAHTLVHDALSPAYKPAGATP